MIYIVRRTQMYFDDDLWQTLHNSARTQGTTVSDLVRRAVREKYLVDSDVRMKAMQDVVGIRKDRPELFDSTGYVRSLRKGKRIAALELR